MIGNAEYFAADQDLADAYEAGELTRAEFIAARAALADTWSVPSTLAAQVVDFTAEQRTVLDQIGLLNLTGTVATVGDLPGGAANGDTYVVSNNGHAYIRLTGVWKDLGPYGGRGGVAMFSVTGAPPSDLGIAGDLALDLATGDFYGPKAAGGWGAPVLATGLQAKVVAAQAALDDTAAILDAVTAEGISLRTLVTSGSSRSPLLVALVAAANGDVPLWLEGGKLGAAGIAPSFVELLRASLDNVVQAAGLTTPQALGASGLRQGSGVPLVTDAAGNVAAWLEEGKLSAAGVGPSYVPLLVAALNGIVRGAGVSLIADYPGALKKAGTFPLVLDAANNVPLWLDEGKLAAAGLSPSLITLIVAALNGVVRSAGLALLSDYTGNSRTVGSVPLVIDAQNNVPVWLEEGKLGAAGVAPGFLSLLVSQILGTGQLAPKTASPSAGRSVLATDGRSLVLYKASLAILRQTGAGIARVGFTGDSWAEQVRIPQALSTLLTAAFGKSGEGWISVVGAPLNGVTVSKSAGWTVYDMTDSLVTPPPHGCGPDGFAIYTATATATYTIGNLTTTSFVFYYLDDAGTFRYRVDGGSWTTVVCASSGLLKSIALTGLSNAVHAFEIDTAGNTGIVTLYGGIAERAAIGNVGTAVGGVTIYKLGNGSAEGGHFSLAASEIGKYSADLKLDVLVFVLGTNDQRFGRGVTSYIAGIQADIDAHKTANPNLGVILVAPPQNGWAVVSPAMSAYRDAMLSFAQANGYEFYSMYDDWSTYAVEQPRGQWADTIHISDAAAWRPARALMRHFLGA